MGGEGPMRVVAVKEVGSAMPKELWDDQMPLPGDIILQLGPDGLAPFPAGKADLQDQLRRLYRTSQPVPLKVKRLHHVVHLTAYVVAEECCIPKKHFTLRASSDVRHVVILEDSTEDACAQWQESTRRVLDESAEQRTAAKATSFRQRECSRLQEEGFNDSVVIKYPWQSKMEECLPCPGSSMMFSILFMPPSKQGSHELSESKDLEYTVARAMTWLCAAQDSGVPVIFVNIQTELIPGDCISVAPSLEPCRVDLAESARYSIGGWEGLKVEIAQGVRLWYASVSAEMAFDLKLLDGHMKYGLDIGRTLEGFCHVTAVEAGSAGDRAGLREAYESAKRLGKQMVISRVAGKKVTPWMVSPGGSIHCYDIKEALQLAKGISSVQIHIMLCPDAYPQSSHASSGIVVL